MCRLCRDCYCELPLPPAGVCARCGAPVAGPAVCTRCFPHAPAFDSCVVGCVYRYPVDRMIKRLKYQARLDLVHALSRPLIERIRREVAVVPDCLVPVPLHRSRQRRRGFNQAREIAGALSRSLSLQADDRLVRRHKASAQQYGLRRESRAKNVMGVFSIVGSMSYKRIAVVDDILTTGATANELARLLKDNGAESVQIWCLAHAAPAS